MQVHTRTHVPTAGMHSRWDRRTCTLRASTVRQDGGQHRQQHKAASHRAPIHGRQRLWAAPGGSQRSRAVQLLERPLGSCPKINKQLVFTFFIEVTLHPALPLSFTLWCVGRFKLVKDPLGSHLRG
jgi:hypothetical protein